MSGSTPAPTRIQRLRAWASRETTGGALLIGAAFLALLWANSPWRDAYESLSGTVVGPAAIGPLPVHLDLSLATWAADGLLAIFFFVVGVELKQEFVAGSLRNPKEAGVPMIAAVGGMAVPALIYVGTVLALGEPGALHGWAIPTATDIAFAVGVLAIFGRGLPSAIRTFLLTLAVVDDLLAIVVIAIFYTSEIHWLSLLGTLVCVALFAWHVRSRRPRWFVLVPLAVVAWALMHSSGVHATIAGVLLGFTVPAIARHGEAVSRTTRYEHRLRPVSSGIALPVFAFFAAGVSLVDGGGPAAVIGQPVVAAIAGGLVIGKLVGVLGTTALVTRLTPLRLPDGIGVRDLLPVGLLAGIGFTVSLLISELSFGDSEHTDGAKIAILGGSVLAAILGSVSLRWDARKARTTDMNLDGREDEVRDYIGDAKDRETH
ncbi:Na+/H+ antiporter NhaA [Promicromonospora thailandica]|uniref:Na(+)/H(+) antiporter NhaA n=1 Tax=Promicromonospora thailandica TaxID=765201 RepID=A0A9X2FXF4_9MICO|nr:Na+/H+ antiporter NhaA [Promicromonospora thailandica]MCP2263110.1 Na+:H+ antiporter, NhaA family [Promicromonospora thailandica]BFF18488.1 Na+/H+ antiporter NhaA [Promicromonospora thailandica]